MDRAPSTLKESFRVNPVAKLKFPFKVVVYPEPKMVIDLAVTSVPT